MLVELLASDNYVCYNRRLAEILGVKSAIYLSEILNINEKAYRKKAFDEENYFDLDRDYFTRRTALTTDEQLEIENNLTKLKIILKPKKDSCKIYIDTGMIISLLSSEDESLINSVSNVAKLRESVSKRNKAESIKSKLKEKVSSSNEELIKAYYEWIDAVYTKQGWMNAQNVASAQQTVDNFSNRDLDRALELIHIATENGYRDMNWAIRVFNERHKFNAQPMSTNIKASVIDKGVIY